LLGTCSNRSLPPPPPTPDEGDADRRARLPPGVTDLDLDRPAVLATVKWSAARRGVGLLLRRPASTGAVSLLVVVGRGDGDRLRRRLARLAVARPPDVRLRPPE